MVTEQPLRKNPLVFEFDEIFRKELDKIRERREANGGPPIDPPDATTVPSARHSLVGLALSGGGVRSASFSLGVLQALSAKDVLKRIDYLSTVSGGGYIGTAMTIAMSRNGGSFPFGKKGTDSDETPETRHLRDNSRYLIQNGFPSIVSAAAVYMRGIVMNLLVLAPILITAGIALIWVHESLEWLKDALLPKDWAGTFKRGAALSLAVGAALLLLWTVYVIVVSVARIGKIEVRRTLALVFARILLILGLLSLVELHAYLLGVSIEATANYAQRVVLTIFPVVLAVLPFLRRLGNVASKGAEDDGWSDFSKRILSSVMLFVLAAIVPLGLWLTAMALAEMGMSAFGDAPWMVSAIYVGAAAILFLTWPFLSVNANSLHQLYRDRLGTAFLARREKEDLVSDDDFCLSAVNVASTPYHLINAALNVPGAKVANMRGRNAQFFVFSPCFIGSELTGYVKTRHAESVVDRLNIGTAMAISGAAAAPNMGMVSIKPLSPTIAFLNVRLGRWVQHPDWIARRFADALMWRHSRRLRAWLFRYPGPRYLLREAFFKTGMKLGRNKEANVKPKSFLFLSDGGHIENLGVYELLRRRCKLIIAVDAEADSKMDCGSLVQVERFARIDLDTRITIDWQPIRVRTHKVGEQAKEKAIKYAKGPHVALGVIDYPPPKGSTDGADREKGVLIYIKSSLSGDENDYILAYKSRYPSFPHESTADQLFSEEQLEVYRSLGEHITRHFLDGADKVARYPDHSGLLAQAREILPQMRPPVVKPATPPAPATGVAMPHSRG